MTRPTISASLLICFAFLFSCPAKAQVQLAAPALPPPSFSSVHNDFFNVDQNGARVHTRSGCLRQFNGLFYWYGSTNRFYDQTCYVSSDLVHWTYKGVALHCEKDADRMDVLYNDATKAYVMFLKYFTDGAFFAIATSPTPEGPYTFKTQTLVDNAKMGDMSLYQDTDGKAYLCYVSWAVGTNAQHGIYLLSPDYLTLEKRIHLWDIRGREAPHLFKRNGIYYYGTSKTAGIRSSGTSYYTATNLAGPWSPAKPLNTPGSNNSWDCQVDFVYQFQGAQGTVYMFAGDRWIKNQGRQGDYVWLPMEFDGDVPTVNYYQDWDLNIAAGTWRKLDPSRNLALGKPASATSALGTNVAANVTNPTTYQNYLSSEWISDPSDPQSITVDLGAAVEINRVILKWGATSAKEFKIRVSSDANAWTDVYSSTVGSPYSVLDESFKATTARYVRMAGVQRATERAGFGRRGAGFGDATREAQAATQPAVAPPAATQPAAPAGYSLFSFQVLKD